MWTRRRHGDSDKHWSVRLDGQYVGTVYRADHLPRWRTDRWSWGAQTHPGGHGYTETLDEALEMVRQTVLRDGVHTLPPEPPKWRREWQDVDPEDQVEW